MTRRGQFKVFAFSLCAIGFVFGIDNARDLFMGAWCALALTAAAS